MPVENASLRPTGGKPVIVRREIAPDARFVKKQSRLRKWLLENIPYYDKVDGPIHSVNYRLLLPWLLVVILMGFILLNIIGNKSKDAKNLPEPSVTASITADPNATDSVNLVIGGTALAPTPTVKSKTPQATPTLSGALPTAILPTPTVISAPIVKAKVVTATGLHIRLNHCVTDNDPQCKIISVVVNGEIVDITGGSVVQDGYQWWPVTYKGQSGWAVKDFLQAVNP
jgi:hypothetical protein